MFQKNETCAALEECYLMSNIVDKVILRKRFSNSKYDLEKYGVMTPTKEERRGT